MPLRLNAKQLRDLVEEIILVQNRFSGFVVEERLPEVVW